MNCRPTDLAVIVKAEVNPLLIGRFVMVLEAAPSGEFLLPSGKKHSALPADMAPWWICEFQQPVRAPTSSGYWTTTLYAPVPDDFLRPIRPQPDDATDEMVLIAGKPEQVAA